MSILGDPYWVRAGGAWEYWTRYKGRKVGEVMKLVDDAGETTYRATMEPEFNRFAGAGPQTVDFDSQADANDYVTRGLRLYRQDEQRRAKEGARTRQWEHRGDDVLITMDGAVEAGRVERRGVMWYSVVYDPAGEAVDAPWGTQDEAQKHVTRQLAARDWTAWRDERQRINEASAARKAEATATLTQISEGPTPEAKTVGATAKADYTPPAYATAPPVKAPPWPGDPYWGRESAESEREYLYLPSGNDQPDGKLGFVEPDPDRPGRFLAVVGGAKTHWGLRRFAKEEVKRLVEVIREEDRTEEGETIDEFAMELRRHAEEHEAEAQSARLALSEVLAYGPALAVEQLRSRSDDRAEESRRLSDAAVLVAEGIARRKLAKGDVVEGNENASATHGDR